jgi:hypothetical protein
MWNTDEERKRKRKKWMDVNSAVVGKILAVNSVAVGGHPLFFF